MKYVIIQRLHQIAPILVCTQLAMIKSDLSKATSESSIFAAEENHQNSPSFLGIVTFEDIGIHRMRQIITIHLCQNYCSTRKCFFYHIRPLISRSLLSMMVFLWWLNHFLYQISIPETTRAYFLVMCSYHSSLIKLSSTKCRQSLFLDEI